MNPLLLSQQRFSSIMDAIVDSSEMMGEGAGSNSPPAAHTTAEDVVSVVEDAVLPAEVEGVEEEAAEPASQKRVFTDAFGGMERVEAKRFLNEVVPLVEFGGGVHGSEFGWVDR
jgi:hypothetical protein